MSKKIKTPKKPGKKIYEVGYHIVSSVAEENVLAEVEKIKTALSKEKAEIISEDTPKLRPLAYEIKKAYGGKYKTFDKAYFGWIKFEIGEEDDIKNIELAIKSNENILRYLLIKTLRENTMYYPKISVFSDRENKAKVTVHKEEKVSKPVSMEEIDKSIDELIEENKVI